MARFRDKNRIRAGKKIIEYGYYALNSPGFIDEEDIDFHYKEFDTSEAETTELEIMLLKRFEKWVGSIEELNDWGPSKHSH